MPPVFDAPLPPGVYGRVAHLADMRDKRYRLAVTAAMGKDFDGVVVKDGELGLAHVKQQFAGAGLSKWLQCLALP